MHEYRYRVDDCWGIAQILQIRGHHQRDREFVSCWFESAASGSTLDLSQVFPEKHKPNPKRNRNEERRRGGEIDLLGLLTQEY